LIVHDLSLLLVALAHSTVHLCQQNIIPERDLVPKIDDVAQNWQSIRCEADFEDVVGCHSAARSLCEILFSCGSEGHPIPCNCVLEFGYAVPEQTPGSAGPSFEEQCGIAT